MGMRLSWSVNEAIMAWEEGLCVWNKKLMVNDSILLRKRLTFHWMQIFWMSTKERTVLCSCLI